MGFRPFRTTPVSVAMPDGRAMAALCAISASGMPISRPSADRPLRGSCISRNFRKRYANGQWLGVAGAGRRIAQARIVATAHSSPSHKGPEIDVRRGRASCHPAMALREIIGASEHAADPVQAGLGSHTPQHCSGTSSVSFGFSQKESHAPCISGAAKMCSACPLCQANRDQSCYRCTAKLLLCNQD